VSIAKAQKVAEALAPLKAIREIGRIESGRADEFGFKEPTSTLAVVIGGSEHRLAIGGPTPSGGNRYVRDEATGVVYAVRGDFVRDLESAENSLPEREMHEFQDADILSVRLISGGKAREILRRGPATKRIWADPATPDTPDETVANWLSKVDRLQPTDAMSELPRAQTTVRIEYAVKGADGAFFELAKALDSGSAPDGTGKPDYFVRSERTRLWSKVYAPWAEQVEQDLASVVK
jgi:hypothetical protein